jgi:WD40 repeat protein
MSTPIETNGSPYKGLEPYKKKDHKLFFGRKHDTEVIISNLRTTELTVLYGVSGVGKSSVLMAGVEPALMKMREGKADGRKKVRHALVIFRDWQNKNLLSALRGAVLREVCENAVTTVKDDPKLSFEEFLSQCTRALQGPVFFVFDQFEEYLLYHEPSEEEHSFETQFARIVNSRPIEANFLLSLREEDLSKLDRFQGAIPNLLGNMLRLEYLDRKSAEEAIRLPLETYNANPALPADRHVAIEDELVMAVLHQAQLGKTAFDGTGQGLPREKVTGNLNNLNNMRVETPILQMMMSRLWHEEVRTGSRVLRHETFTRLGKGHKIISTYLDEAMGQLTPEDCDIAARLFLFLVTPTGTKVAHRIDDLASREYTGYSDAQLRPILDRLSTPELRILRTVNAPGQPVRYEIYHDVLAPAILDWRRRFVAWREAEKIRHEEEARRQQALAAAEQEKQRIRQEEEARRQAALAKAEREKERIRLEEERLRAEALAKAEREKEKIRQEEEQRHERALAAAAEKRRQELIRNWRRAALVFAACLLVIAVLAVFSRYKANQAEAQRKQARSRELAAQAALQVHLNPELSLLLAIKAVETEPTHQAEAALRQAFAFNNSRPTTSFTGHEDIVSQALFSADGQSIITASDDHTARVWSVAAPQATPTVLRHTGAVQRMTLHDNLLATETNSGAGAVWNISTGQQLFQLTELDGTYAVILFNPDGQKLLSETNKGAKLWDVANHKEICTLTSGPIHAAQFSADGKWVITAPINKGRNRQPAQVWNPEKCQSVGALPPPGTSVDYVAFSPDSTLMLMASDDSNQVSIWKTDQWHEAARVRQMGLVKDAVFSPNGQFVAVISQARLKPAPDDNPTRLTPDATSESNVVEVWSTQTLGSVAKLRGHTANINTVAFSADERFIVTASDDTTARVWNVASGQEIAQLGGHAGRVTSAAFSPDGRLIVTSSADKTARVWRVDDLAKGLSLPVHALVNSIAFSPDSKRLLIATDIAEQFFGDVVATDKTTILGKPTVWDTTTGQSALPLKGQDGAAYKAVYSPNGQQIAALVRGGQVCVWDANTGELRWTELSVSRFFSAPFSPDGKLFLAKIKQNSGPQPRGEQNGNNEKETVKLFDLSTKQQVSELALLEQKVNDASFSPDGQFVVTASGDYYKYLIGRVPNPTNLSPADGEKIPTARIDNSAQIFDAASGQPKLDPTGKEKLVLYHNGPVLSVAYNLGGSLLVTASADRTARLWDAATGKQIALLNHSGVVFKAVFSPDGNYIVTACEDNKARLWDGHTGKPIAEFEHPDAVWSASFSSNSKFVLTRSRDKITRLWDVISAQEISELPSTDIVYDNAFSPDGQLIAVASGDNPVRIYTCDVCLPLPDLLQLAKQRVTRQLTEEEISKY